ncbi:uncharacterized protein N7500_002235 [Penicillium coprophilum]|uniref:uncharacterized protein n=1 Tax=Penicillium coprophilum TaxID=36646 RepID=UPI00238B6FDD|nr:uncharacterized protein N7500_002235 [Penicillium coprophilum]KAJ5169452.1 hypothetical protein N7500_002235 [Penicillium coprophilum]
MIAQAATRHQPSPFSHPNRGRKYAPNPPHIPESVYPVSSIHPLSGHHISRCSSSESTISSLASDMPYFSDFNIEHPMPQTWQLSSITPMACETQPIDSGILQKTNEPDKDPMKSQAQELGVLGGPVCFDSMKFTIIEDQPQSSISPTSSNSRHTTWPSSAKNFWQCPMAQHERARRGQSDETESSLGSVRPPSLPLEEQFPDGFVSWDPADPGRSDKIREKVPRNKAEIQQQKEDIAALKKAGGSCMACYRAKKKCGTTTPCSPCSSKGNRICFRSWGDLCLLGPPTGNSLTILGFPSQEAKDNLQRMSEEVFKRMNAFNAVFNIRETYGGDCTAWHWTAKRSSITLSSKAECPVHDFLAGVTSVLPLVDLVKFKDQHKPNTLVWYALKIAKLFMAIQGLARARIRTSWFEISTGRLVSFYILILSFRKLAEMSQEFCPGLYVALCGKDKQNNKKRPRKESEIHPAWVAAALYYRVVCGLQGLQTNPVVARIFGSSSYHLGGVREKLEYILRNVSPRHGATGKSSSRAILEDGIPNFPSSPDVDIAFWLGVPDDPEQMQSALSRHESPFSPPATEMQVFLADHLPRPWHEANHVEQHNEHSQSVTSQDTVISQEHNTFENMTCIDQIEIIGSNSLLTLFGTDSIDAFNPMAATFVDTMPLDTMPFNDNFSQSLYNC